MPIKNLFYIFYATFFGSFFIGSLGFVTGLWATKFDHTATITNFVIQPLSFLSGVFYTIDRLPSFFQTLSSVNPFFHIINIFRYGFLGVSDGPLFFGLIYLPILALLGWLMSFFLYKKGYKIKS
jgi:ABC-2 type transport system permease protein